MSALRLRDSVVHAQLPFLIVGYETGSPALCSLLGLIFLVVLLHDSAASMTVGWLAFEASMLTFLATVPGPFFRVINPEGIVPLLVFSAIALILAASSSTGVLTCPPE